MDATTERPSPAELIDLSGAVVAVTGAGGGLGSGIARRFAAAGARVVLHYRSSVDAIAALVAQLDVPVAVVHADLTEPAGAHRVVEAAADQFGRLDVLVNNAGIQPVTAFEEMTAQQWREMIDTDLTAVHLATQAAARHMTSRGGGGSIIHIASIEGVNPAGGHGHYATAKAGVIMHARAAALELGRHRIRVNTVSPGLIHRPGIETDWPDGVERWRAAAPLTRLGTADDIGDACVFLASPLADWITGANLVVDGGMTARPTW
ncbi:MAG: SDR family NAD(P)-dependent oxidoreductase [Acidimicrobiales bacterium]